LILDAYVKLQNFEMVLIVLQTDKGASGNLPAITQNNQHVRHLAMCGSTITGKGVFGKLTWHAQGQGASV